MIDPRKHPHELISKDGYGLTVIVIAPAYRVNIFGFLGADEEGLNGNWGFWDQRCAMEWVAENVKYFGGDPENVTLGGVSAGIFCVICLTTGAYSVQAQLSYELFQAADKSEKPLFHRVWMSSNAILVSFNSFCSLIIDDTQNTTRRLNVILPF